jgi:hypothetical protein
VAGAPAIASEAASADSSGLLYMSVFLSNLPVELEEFSEGAKDHLYVGAGLFACHSGVMMNTLLGDGVAFSDGSGKNLSIDQGAGADHADVAKYFCFVELEGAINVTHPHSEQQTDQFSPAPGIYFSDEVVLPVESVATHNIILLNQGQQRRHFCDIELAVTIGVEDKLPGGGPEAGLQGCAIAEIGAMVNDFYPFVSGGDFIGNAPGSIGTSVVNNNYLKVRLEAFQNRKCLLGGAGDVVLLVVAGEEDAYRDHILAGGFIGCLGRVLACHASPPFILQDVVSLGI